MHIFSLVGRRDNKISLKRKKEIQQCFTLEFLKIQKKSVRDVHFLG